MKNIKTARPVHMESKTVRKESKEIPKTKKDKEWVGMSCNELTRPGTLEHYKNK